MKLTRRSLLAGLAALPFAPKWLLSAPAPGVVLGATLSAGAPTPPTYKLVYWEDYNAFREPVRAWMKAMADIEGVPWE